MSDLKQTRIPVNLYPEENALFIRLKAALELEQQRSLSVAAIIRLAIIELAKAKNVS